MWNMRIEIPPVLPDYFVKNGYRVEERGDNDALQRANDEDRLIIIWSKGLTEFSHFKCDGPSVSGPFVEGIGESVEECLNDWIEWSKTLERESK